MPEVTVYVSEEWDDVDWVEYEERLGYRVGIYEQLVWLAIDIRIDNTRARASVTHNEVNVWENNTKIPSDVIAELIRRAEDEEQLQEWIEEIVAKMRREPRREEV